MSIVQNCHHFHERTHSERWEGGWVNGRRMLFKMLLVVHCDFEKGSRNEHFQHRAYPFDREGGVTKKEYSVCALDDGDNSGRLQEVL